MPAPVFRPHLPWRACARGSVALVVPLLLAACVTPLQPVADFGGAAGRLVDDYKPFTTGIDATCEQREHYMALAIAGPFDDAQAQRDAEARCARLKKDGATAALFGRALSDYASALVKLSGASPKAFDSGIKDVGGTVAGLETRDATPLFDAHKIGAATKIARAAAAVVLEGRIQRLERATLEQNQDALATTVDAMKTFAGTDYLVQLRQTQGIMKGELERLKTASTSTDTTIDDRLPWRWAQIGMRNDIAANELQQRRAADFARSADALLAAHGALIANFDKLDGAKRLELVTDFVHQVQALDDDIAAL